MQSFAGSAIRFAGTAIMTAAAQSVTKPLHGVRFRHKFTLEDAIGSHTCSLEANMRVINGIPLGCSLLLPVDAVNFFQTLKVGAGGEECCNSLR
jgi:hypothetical protein